MPKCNVSAFLACAFLFFATITGCGTKDQATNNAPATQTAPTPAPAPAPAAQPPAPAPSAAPSGPAPISTGDTNITGVVAEVTDCTRKEGVLSFKVRLRNTSAAAKRIPVLSGRNQESYYLSAGNKKYFVLKDSEGTYLMPRADGFGGLDVDVNAGEQYILWAKFAAPPADVKAVTLYMPIAPPIEDIPVTDK